MFPDSSNSPSCGLCKDINEWMEAAKKSALDQAHSVFKKDDPYEPFPIPPDADQLGRETWTFLHTLAAYYPLAPTVHHQENARGFFYTLPSMYPCHVCAEHLKDELQINPPRVSSNIELSDWLCEVHNGVNGRLGKPIFNCSKVLERWKLGIRERVLSSSSIQFSNPNTTMSSKIPISDTKFSDTDTNAVSQTKYASLSYFKAVIFKFLF